jgi:hypothetical protein
MRERTFLSLIAMGTPHPALSPEGRGMRRVGEPNGEPYPKLGEGRHVHSTALR